MLYFSWEKRTNFSSHGIAWLESRSIKIRHLKRSLITDETAVTISGFGYYLHWLSISKEVRQFVTRMGVITDMGIIKFAEGCPHLLDLDPSFCVNITDDSLIRIVELCPRLKTLKLEICQITDRSIIRIAEGYPNLYSFKLRCCDQKTDMSMIQLADACHNLHILDLSYCFSAITDTSIIRLAERCPYLSYLDLSGNSFTDRGIVKIAEGCPDLHTW
jgi:hypothetical protein